MTSASCDSEAAVTAGKRSPVRDRFPSEMKRMPSLSAASISEPSASRVIVPVGLADCDQHALFSRPVMRRKQGVLPVSA